MPTRPGPPPPSHLHVLHGAPAHPPRSMTARGLLYWLASLVAAANASVSLFMALSAALPRSGLQLGPMYVVAAKLPLWGAAIALIWFPSPAALTLLAPTLALVQVGDLMLGVRTGNPVRLGTALLFSVSTLAVSIPLLAEQALKRRRWRQAARARGQLPRP